MATLNELLDEVRGMAGDPDTTEISAILLTKILTGRALNWLNHRRPSKTITSFTTVDDQQDYDEKPSNAYNVTNVWWMDADFEFFSPEMRYIPTEHDINLQMAGFSTLDNPALVEAFYKKISAYRNNFKGSGKETDSGLIRLEPCPNSDGDVVYFEYTHSRFAAVTDVTEEFLEGLRYQAAALTLERLYIKRGMIRSGRSFTGGGGTNERDLSKDYKLIAEQEIPIPLAIFSRG